MGIIVFPTLEHAVNAGYQVLDRVPEGYLVRTRTEAGWALALARA